MIIEHISDSHEWHICELHGKAVAVPLPVIIYSNKGFDFFLSNKFEEGKVEGKYNYALEHNHIIAVDEAGKKDETATASFIDFSITKNVATLLFSAFCLLYIFLSIIFNICT